MTDTDDHDPIRPYVLTRGRSTSAVRLGVETLLESTGTSKTLHPTASRHHRRLWHLCQKRLALVEAAAYMNLPVSVVTILAGDLIHSGHLTPRSPAPRTQLPDIDVLQEILDGLRRRLPA